MSEYVHIISDDSITVINTSNGESLRFFNTDEKFEEIKQLVIRGDYNGIFEKDIKKVVSNFFDEGTDFIRVVIQDGIGLVYLHGVEYPLSSTIINKILKMKEQGFSCNPILNFLSNLLANPSSSAVNELYDFIKQCELPITEDGHFIAYKIVREDYMDIYTGTIRNMVGDVPAMLRNQVDDNRSNTCSKGLHFCSKGYLTSYGSSTRDTDRCMLVKINPADVVSIPVDYNFAKGRAWTYEVVGEVEGNWREWLHEKDFTESAVVNEEGAELEKLDNPDDQSNHDEEFIESYKLGYADGKKKATFNNAGLNSGYELGYKHGKNHRAKLYK